MDIVTTVHRINSSIRKSVNPALLFQQLRRRILAGGRDGGLVWSRNDLVLRLLLVDRVFGLAGNDSEVREQVGRVVVFLRALQFQREFLRPLRILLAQASEVFDGLFP